MGTFRNGGNNGVGKINVYTVSIQYNTVYGMGKKCVQYTL